VLRNTPTSSWSQRRIERRCECCMLPTYVHVIHGTPGTWNVKRQRFLCCFPKLLETSSGIIGSTSKYIARISDTVPSTLAHIEIIKQEILEIPVSYFLVTLYRLYDTKQTTQGTARATFLLLSRVCLLQRECLPSRYLATLRGSQRHQQGDQISLLSLFQNKESRLMVNKLIRMAADDVLPKRHE
jgi:hypothetical protein